MTTVGFTGHQNMPAAALGFIEQGIRESLRRAGRPLAGVASLAAGADQLFAALLLEAGGSLDIIVPCAGFETTFTDPGVLATYRGLLRRARALEQLPFAAPSEEAFMAAGVRVIDRCDLLVAVWDGRPAAGLGGTGDVVRRAHAVGRPVQVVWPAGVTR
ncbi:hypothetical protein GCM10020358_39680 [Amorphoplanes nipponensis]|uniref:DNA recombination-mediator protein A n=1 Tax=Actinoplanes nipponensis TaxID=135950 RepID=A0A919JQA6_9ACTN|nr:hypothetical protein [Actinoplanes nipponensis]GIE50994.1 hypothetical protein Ani05nite_45280 [Actinoplanes nipponensis]